VPADDDCLTINLCRGNANSQTEQISVSFNDVMLLN